MRKIARHGALAATLLIIAMPAVAQTRGNFCTFTPVKYCDGCVADRTLRVRPGSSCIIRSNPGGGALLGYDFSVRPKLGKLGKANGFTYGYQAPNTPGTDYFENVIYWQVGIAKQSVRIRNFVTIVPDVR